MSKIKELQKKELEILEKIDDLIARRDKLNSSISAQRDTIDEFAENLKNQSVLVLTGEADKASVDKLQSRFDKLIGDDSHNRKELNLVTDAVKRLKGQVSTIKQQIRTATRDKLRSSAHSKSEIESELKELAIRYLIAIEIESGVVATSINIGRALEWAVIGKEGFGRSQLMSELVQRKDSILGEVTA